MARIAIASTRSSWSDAGLDSEGSMGVVEAGKGRVRGFDGIRGIAAVAVVAHHYGYRGTALGDAAVLVFFALSGFLIVGILHALRLQVERERRSFASAFREFWTNRILRIFPAYYVVLLVATLTELHVGYVSLWNGLPWYVLYLQNFYVGLLQPFWLTLAHTWTLAVEQQFYLLAAPAFLLVEARLHAALATSLLLISASIWIALGLAGMSDHSLRLLPPHGFAYAAAGGLAYLLGRRIDLPAPGAVALAVAATLAVLVFSAGHLPWAPLAPSSPIPSIASLACCSLLVWATAQAQPSRWTAYLDCAPLRALGAISYGLYIVHVPIAFALARPGNAWIAALGAPKPLHGPLFFLLVLSLSIAAASVLYLCVERPALRLKRHMRTGRMPDPLGSGAREGRAAPSPAIPSR
jgi:peptidoglycan/LPS O-acetylase OafA/YrhL